MDVGHMRQGWGQGATPGTGRIHGPRAKLRKFCSFLATSGGFTVTLSPVSFRQNSGHNRG